MGISPPAWLFLASASLAFLAAPPEAGPFSLPFAPTALFQQSDRGLRDAIEDDALSTRGAPKARNAKKKRGKSPPKSPPKPGGKKRQPRRPRSRPVVGGPVDQSHVPRGDSPSVSAPSSEREPALLGWSRSLAQPRFADRRRRLPRTERPASFGHTLHPGEELRFNVTFAGNPVGLAEARIVSREPDPRGPPPRGAPVVVIEGHARTSGILSLLSTITDDARSRVDAGSGAPIWSENVISYEGWSPRKYRRRVTRTDYHGRGQIRVVDRKDKKKRKLERRVPLDTFDPMSSMAWVRSLRLGPGEHAKAHAMDGTALLRVEIVGRGRGVPDPLPGIARALGVKKGEIDVIEGTITRVDKFDRAIPEKRVYRLRAWLSADERRIPLALESDMWVGAMRLDLAQYQPPQ